MIEQPFRAGPGQQRQMEIYQLGLVGKTPATPVSVEALEQQARKKLKTETFDCSWPPGNWRFYSSPRGTVRTNHGKLTCHGSSRLKRPPNFIASPSCRW
jgi:hypothetical protein